MAVIAVDLTVRQAAGQCGDVEDGPAKTASGSRGAGWMPLGCGRPETHRPELARILRVALRRVADCLARDLVPLMVSGRGRGSRVSCTREIVQTSVEEA